MTRLALVIGVTLVACKSSAPYTVPAAALNSAIGLGAAAGQRAAGGCYATCTNGTVCNPRTGLCEARSVTDVCAEAPGGGTRCVPLEIGKKEAAPPGSTLPIGISPATGTVPPPPNESSPRAP